MAEAKIKLSENKIKLTKAEKRKILERLEKEPEAIRDYRDALYADLKFLHEAIACNGECLYYIDKKFRLNQDLVKLAARTNPEWLDVLDPRELGKKSTIITLTAGMLSNGFRLIREHLGNEGFNEELEDYMNFSRKKLMEKSDEYETLKHMDKLAKRIKALKAKLEKMDENSMSAAYTQSKLELLEGEQKYYQLKNDYLINEEQRKRRAFEMTPPNKSIDMEL